MTGKELISIGDKFSWHFIVCYNKLKCISVLNKRNEVGVLNKSVDYYYTVYVRSSVEGGSPVMKFNNTECYSVLGI